MTYLKRRKNAFTYALRGLNASLKKEAHMRIHVTATVLVVVAGLYFRISINAWAAVISCAGLVMIAELFNTVAERICDLVSTEQRPEIGYIKDISAAAVLLACIVAVVVGLLVFLPYLLR